MGNMSYCRFENTYRDLQDCLNALQNEDLSELSESEKRYAKELIETCKEISDEADTFIEEIEA